MSASGLEEPRGPVSDRSGCVNLVLVRDMSHVGDGDFEQIAELAEKHDRRVKAHVLPDKRSYLRSVRLMRRPSFVFATGPLKRFRPLRGRVFQGRPIPKSGEYRALAQAGVAVPRWAVLTETQMPDLSEFGPYVVVKPDHGGRGADVRVYRKSRVRWKPREIDRGVRRGTDRIVQDFIHTGTWPLSYRVVTLFGEAIMAFRVEADHSRSPLRERYGFGEAGGVTIVSNSRGCSIRLDADDEVVRFAQSAHRAFPDLALLGVDVLRESGSGKLYVIEVNSVGWTWHFSSPDGQRVRRETGGDAYQQLGGLPRVARILADRAVALAR